MTRRGLTLIEVLLATVLLAIIGNVCLSLLSGASEHLQRENTVGDQIAQADLERTVDLIVKSPALVEAESLLEVASGDLPWSDALLHALEMDAPPHALTIEHLRSQASQQIDGEDEEQQRFGWLVFHCGQRIALRRIEMTDEDSERAE